MTLTQIAVAAGIAALYGFIVPKRWRGWLLMLLSLLAVYWFSPSLTIHHLDFVLPTLTIGLTIFVWLMTRPADARTLTREDWIVLAVVAGLVLLLSATRYLIPSLRPTPSRAPDVPYVFALIALVGAAIIMVLRVLGRGKKALTGIILFIVVLFIFLKSPSLTIAVSRGLRSLSGQNVGLARVSDIAWLGFSYVAFRWIHMLRDRQTGKLPALSLQEALSYVLFFPALIAGPIDRAERFQKDFQTLPDLQGRDAARFTEGVTRIVIGIAKKFVIADTLALMALNAANAEQITSAFAGWGLLYAYAFRLFFDFSGYSDIAIGIGILFGIRLPENFDRPYLKQNIAAFWQSWHMTLSNWVRFYVFSPLSRFLLTRKPRPPMAAVVFASQLATMVVIGLWHGITWTFLIWGVWHGVGLFIHKRWSDRTRKWYMGLREKPRLKTAWTIAGVVITFHFVVLGWVWFALPDAGLALQVFLKLFGVGV